MHIFFNFPWPSSDVRNVCLHLGKVSRAPSSLCVLAVVLVAVWANIGQKWWIHTHTHTQSWCEHGLNASQIFAQDNWSRTLGSARMARDERGFVKICTPRRLLVRLLRRSSGRARFGGNFLFLLELLYLAGGPQQQRQGVSQTFIADASSHIVILYTLYIY